MPGGRHLVLSFVLWFSVPLSACPGQGVSQGVDSSQVGNVHVRVEYPGSRPAGPRLRVRLMSGSGSTVISENFTDQQGSAQFISVPIGIYHVVVSGDGIQDGDSGEFEVDRRKISQSVFVTVQPVSSSAGVASAGGPALVSKADLAVPGKARKEFDRGVKAMGDQNWSKALQHLIRAIEIYPQYAMAYNNLGVVYGHLNDASHEQEALRKAIDADSHFAPAYVNLAKLCLQEHDTTQAETLLENANRVEPNNAETLTLLAQMQLLNKHFDAAIGTARSVHGMAHTNLAVVHYIAARAMERAGRPQDALAELQVFLTEEPTGARADHARDEMARLQSALTNSGRSSPEKFVAY